MSWTPTHTYTSMLSSESQSFIHKIPTLLTFILVLVTIHFLWRMVRPTPTPALYEGFQTEGFDLVQFVNGLLAAINPSQKNDAAGKPNQRPNVDRKCQSSCSDECESKCCINGKCEPSKSCFGDRSWQEACELNSKNMSAIKCSGSCNFNECSSGCCYGGTCNSAEVCFGISDGRKACGGGGGGGSGGGESGKSEGIICKVGWRNSKDAALKFIQYSDELSKCLSESIVNRLKTNKPLFLVGNSAREFTEFSSLIQLKTTDNRNVIDLSGFASNGSLPGFVSSSAMNCESQVEDILFHELCHDIHTYGMNASQKATIIALLNEYKVQNSNYKIDTYAFNNEMEFFAEMSQVYCGVTIRTDVTVSYGVLKTNLPNMFSFLGTVWTDPNKVKLLSCKYMNCKSFC